MVCLGPRVGAKDLAYRAYSLGYYFSYFGGPGKMLLSQDEDFRKRSGERVSWSAS